MYSIPKIVKETKYYSTYRIIILGYNVFLCTKIWYNKDMEVVNFLESVKDFVYSPVMIGVQVFVALLSLGMAFLLTRIVKDLGGVNRWWEEKRFSLKQGADVDDIQNRPTTQSQFHEQWNNVVRRMNTLEQEQWKLAILEADVLLDRVIQQTGVRGETMGERMKNLNRQSFPLLDTAWQVHGVRNRIAHEPEYTIDASTASRVLALYTRIFVRLGVIPPE